MSELEATAGRAASAWRVAVGVLAVAGGAYFAILAARAAWSDDVDVWRGVRDPKRPTTRRPIASSSLFSPPREMNTSLTFPAASPSPRAPNPPHAHSPGCPHRILRPPRARDIPRAPRAPRRAHRPRAHPRWDRNRVPRQVHPRRPPGLDVHRRRAWSARRRVRPRCRIRRRRRAQMVRRVDARRRPRPRRLPDADAVAPHRARRRAPRVRLRVRVARGNRRPRARAQKTHVPTQESVDEW